MLKGFVLGILLHVCQIGVFYAYGVFVSFLPAGSRQNEWSFAFLYLPFLIGLTQLVYMVPAIALLWRNNRQIAKGVMLVAALTFLLNATCLGFLFSSLKPKGVPLNPLPDKPPAHALLLRRTEPARLSGWPRA